MITLPSFLGYSIEFYYGGSLKFGNDLLDFVFVDIARRITRKEAKNNAATRKRLGSRHNLWKGSLDPLGTYSISEKLASMIGSAGVRERQSNLRFLTLCCVGWKVIAEMDHSTIPGDPGSVPRAILRMAFTPIDRCKCNRGR